MAGHTPGPWIVSPLNGRDVGPVRAFHFEGTDVQQLQSVAIVRERAESDANARLIAAAPELLEAIRKLANEASGFWAMANPDTHGHTNLTVLRERIDNAYAVIAKAEGR